MINGLELVKKIRVWVEIVHSRPPEGALGGMNRWDKRVHCKICHISGRTSVRV